MRYILIGAGAIGSGIGGLLADAGSDVVLVARGEHLEAMRAGGLTIRTPERVIRPTTHAVATPNEITLRADDVLVLTTKTHQAAAALATWADAPVHAADGAVLGTAGDTLPLLTALNGVASEEIALRWFARVYGVCVWMPAVLVAPGEVVVRCAPVHAILHTSRYPAALADDGDRAFLEAVATAWGRAGIQVPLPADVMPWKYRKLLGNLGNSVQALLGERGAGEDIVAAARQEALEVFGAAGIVMNTEDEERESRAQLRVGQVPGAPAELGGSTWQSLQRGTGNAETDYLNGEIVHLAHRMGRAAPVNAALARAVRAAVAEGARPGEVPAERLRELVGLHEATAPPGPAGAVGTPRLRATSVTIGAPDPRALAAFYADLLGVEVTASEPPGPGEPATAGWAQLRAGALTINVEHERHWRPPVWPAREGEQTATQHLDIWVESAEALDRAVEHAVRCGATLAAEQPQAGVRVLIDPAGHPFCLFS